MSFICPLAAFAGGVYATLGARFPYIKVLVK